MKKKTKIILVGLLILITLFLIYYSQIIPIKYTYYAGLPFSEKCQALNGQKFTLENLSSLEGYAFTDVGENSRAPRPFGQEQYNEYLEVKAGTLNSTVWGGNKYLSIIDKHYIFGGGLKSGWFCNTQQSGDIIRATPSFTVDD